MRQIEDKSLSSARRRLIFSLVMVGFAIVYTVSPIDLIPDVLFPAGYLDDIPLLIGTAAYAGYSYWKLKRERRREHA
jgi:uncharacterized membrane protein YkvA (DUF1232 family)